MHFIHRAVVGIMGVFLLGACSDNLTGLIPRAADSLHWERSLNSRAVLRLL